MRALITGVTGMAGSHLAEYILSRHPEVDLYATYRWRSRMENLQDIARQGQLSLIAQGGNISRSETLAASVQSETVSGHLHLIEADLTDPSSVRRLIAAVKPERIFHLAAQSYVPASWTAPSATLATNVSSQVNLLEAIVESGIDPVIQVAGSSEEYGLVHADEVPIKESNPLRPLSTYAVSKVTQEMLAWQYHRSYGLKTIVTRGFNHTGPRRGDVFVTSNFAKQIAEIEAGRKAPMIEVGDLSSRRDWTDVRDMVRGYWLAAEQGQVGNVYNLGCGVARSVGEVLEILLSLSKSKIEVVEEASRFRPSDVKILHADASKFHEHTGWRPEIPFETTMKDLLDYWRERI